MSPYRFIGLPGLLFAVCASSCFAAGPFKLEGAYYREENGKLTHACLSNSIPPQTKVSYFEKFSFRRLESGKIEVLHADALCSDLHFLPETYTSQELVRNFSFSQDGLTLRTDKSIKPAATFKWLAGDPLQNKSP